MYEYEDYEEEVVELLIYKCKMNRSNAYEVAKNNFYPNYLENLDIFKRYSPEVIAKGFVEEYIDEWM